MSEVTSNKLTDLIQTAQAEIDSATTLKLLDDIRVAYLGKQGVITQQLKSIGQLSPEERPLAGQKINQAKQAIEAAINKQKIQLEETLLQAELSKAGIDVTLPGRKQSAGSLHPVSLVMQRLMPYFRALGFTIADGPEIEDEFHNFTALNMPPYHPARAMVDTFYFSDGRLLRTHTSPVQIRIMQKTAPPIKIIAPGRVYRRDSDATHTPMFHQIEGLVVDENTNFADLKGILQSMLEYFFEAEMKLRFRPSYFPFTEPSAEVDIQCVQCHGKGCRICKQTGWLEILGCGMVHPQVLQNVGINPELFQGYAFGVGIDRLAMLRYHIDDLRGLFTNDKRFLDFFIE